MYISTWPTLAILLYIINFHFDVITADDTAFIFTMDR